MHPKKYTINGRTYVQGPLVLGQLLPLCELVEGIKIPAFTVQEIIKALGPKLSEAMAIILIPEGKSPRASDLEALAAIFEEHMTFETALEVVADFLSFNPASSLLEKIRGITASFKKNLGDLAPEKSSSESSTSSPKET